MKKILSMMAGAAIISGMLFTSGCGQIDANEAGFKTWFGKVDTPVLDPGLYFVSPIGGDIWIYPLNDIRTDIKMQAYTKDMQQADFEVSVIHAIDKTKLIELHTKYGKMYAKVILEPVMQAALKDVVGQWEADKLVNGREEATKAIVEKIGSLVKDKPVFVKSIAIMNIDYSDVFEKAIEKKQVAQQAALEAKNKTAQVEEEAKQALVRAKAEAEAIQIRAEALNKNKDVMMLNAIEKWDGILPKTVVLDGKSSLFIQESK